MKPRRFSPLATFLHLFSLIVSLALVCFLSYIIATKPLVDQIPVSATGWIQEGSQRQEFSLGPEAAQRIAALLDMGTYEWKSPETIDGELTITVASKKRFSYQLNAQGVRSSVGFYRQIRCDTPALRAILLSEPKVGTE